MYCPLKRVDRKTVEVVVGMYICNAMIIYGVGKRRSIVISFKRGSLHDFYSEG